MELGKDKDNTKYYSHRTIISVCLVDPDSRKQLETRCAPNTQAETAPDSEISVLFGLLKKYSHCIPLYYIWIFKKLNTHLV